MATASRTTKQRIAKRPKPVKALPPVIPPFPIRRFTVDEYHRMLECGILVDREPYELIHGWMVHKMGVNPPHNYALIALTELFVLLRIPSTNVRIQMPITTSDSEPEPDVVIAAGSKEDYPDRNPSPEEIHVLVEVCDSTLRYDQTTKLELYAEAGVRNYWIVNLIDRRVEVYTEPHGGKKPGYKKPKHYGPTDVVPLVIGGKEVGRIPVKELLV